MNEKVDIKEMDERVKCECGEPLINIIRNIWLCKNEKYSHAWIGVPSISMTGLDINCVDLAKEIRQLQSQLHQAACDISLWREQHHDACQKVIELEDSLKRLREGIERHIKPGSLMSLYGMMIYPSYHMDLAKLVEKG